MIRPNAFRARSVIVILLSLCTLHADADLVIHSSETLTLDSSNSETLFIAGDLIIEDGATLQGASNAEIGISGSWDNSLGGSFIHGGAKVFFSGSGVSVIKGNNNFSQLVVNKKDAISGQEFIGSEIQIESEQTSAVVSNKIEDNKKTLIIDPSQLEPGIFSITAKAVDSAEVVATTEVKTDFRLMQAAPVLSVDTDSDGDGISDAEEGYDDSDNDGIVDYMDNLVEPNLAPVGEDSTIVLQAAAGTKVVLGETAFANAESTVMVTKQQMINVITKRNQNPSLALLDKNYTYPNGLYDFVVSGEIPGNSYYLVLPLEAPFVEGQVFRKYMGPQIGWQNFIENANNSIFSAAAFGGACPEPGSRLFVPGIQAGHTCIQLYIEDGGPNDIDAIANGIVTDPGGVATYTQQGFAPSAENSTLELDKVILTTNNDKAILTITVADENGSFLEGVTIIASCKQCIGVKIGDFNYQGQGIYKAEINSSAWLSNGLIEAIVSNEFGSASLTPKRLVVKFKSTGGCSVVSGQPNDISLFLFLFIFTLLNFVRRRYY